MLGNQENSKIFQRIVEKNYYSTKEIEGKKICFEINEMRNKYRKDKRTSEIRTQK